MLSWHLQLGACFWLTTLRGACSVGVIPREAMTSLPAFWGSPGNPLPPHCCVGLAGLDLGGREMLRDRGLSRAPPAPAGRTPAAHPLLPESRQEPTVLLGKLLPCSGLGQRLHPDFTLGSEHVLRRSSSRRRFLWSHFCRCRGPERPSTQLV